MPINIDLKLYLDKKAACQRLLVEKCELLASTDDPHVKQTLERTVANLRDMLEIYEKTAESLEIIEQLDALTSNRAIVKIAPSLRSGRRRRGETFNV